MPRYTIIFLNVHISSTGVLLWEIVTLGSTPYPGMAAGEVKKKSNYFYQFS
jgi:hypothetical protein